MKQQFDNLEERLPAGPPDFGVPPNWMDAPDGELPPRQGLNRAGQWFWGVAWSLGGSVGLFLTGGFTAALVSAEGFSFLIFPTLLLGAVAVGLPGLIVWTVVFRPENFYPITPRAGFFEGPRGDEDDMFDTPAFDGSLGLGFGGIPCEPEIDRD